MIHFERVAEPPGFDAEARQPGTRWLVAHPNAERPRDYWGPFKPALAAGFKQLCGYSAMYEPVGTVDHFHNWRDHRELAYEWANYRFASAWINGSKQNATVLDPLTLKTAGSRSSCRLCNSS